MMWRPHRSLRSVFVCALAWSFAPALLCAAPRVETVNELRVVHLDGSPYELGRRHGELLREPVRQSVGHMLGHFRRYLRVPGVRSIVANGWLDRSWRQSKPFVPAEYLEELRGLADGSGVPLADLYRLHAIPDRTYACANFAAWGSATADGRLIHLRNLDWNSGVGLQDYATVFVVHPAGKQAFVSVGYAGFIGVLTGVNAQQISIGQVGAETADASYRGIPMPFLMRRVLEQSFSLDEAAHIIQDSPRTVGINYVLGDARTPRGLVVETTRHHAAVFEADDPKERAVEYARPMADCVLRSDTAIDPAIRDRQKASHGKPDRPGLEPPGGSAYEVRYVGQALGLAKFRGQLDVELAKDIAKAVAPDSNVQSVIMKWPELWVANAQGEIRAAQTPYHRLDLEQLFGK